MSVLIFKKKVRKVFRQQYYSDYNKQKRNHTGLVVGCFAYLSQSLLFASSLPSPPIPLLTSAPASEVWLDPLQFSGAPASETWMECYCWETRIGDEQIRTLEVLVDCWWSVVKMFSDCRIGLAGVVGGGVWPPDQMWFVWGDDRVVRIYRQW